MGLRVSRFETARTENSGAGDGQQIMSKYITAGTSTSDGAVTSSSTAEARADAETIAGASGVFERMSQPAASAVEAGEASAGCPVCGQSWTRLGLSFDGQQLWQHEQHVNDCLSRSEVRRVQREENDSISTPFPKRQRVEAQMDTQRGARSSGTSREQLRRTHQVKLTAFMGSPFRQM